MMPIAQIKIAAGSGDHRDMAFLRPVTSREQPAFDANLAIADRHLRRPEG